MSNQVRWAARCNDRWHRFEFRKVIVSLSGRFELSAYGMRGQQWWRMSILIARKMYFFKRGFPFFLLLNLILLLPASAVSLSLLLCMYVC